MKKLFAIGIVMLLIILATVADVAYANVRRTIPNEDPFLPQYSAGVYDAEMGWWAIIFYRYPSCVPNNVDMRIYDLPMTYGGGAYQCPLAVKGFVIYGEEPSDLLDPATWQSYPPSTPPPEQIELHQVDTVPVWFVTANDFFPVYLNGPVTKSDLERMPSLRKGSANFYHETWHFSAGARIPMSSVEARGTFANGLPVKSFKLQSTAVNPPDKRPFWLGHTKIFFK